MPLPLTPMCSTALKLRSSSVWARTWLKRLRRGQQSHTSSRVFRTPVAHAPQSPIRTPLGRALLDDEAGLDPYIEDPATLWVLHWQAVSATTSLPVWWADFQRLHRAGIH